MNRIAKDIDEAYALYLNEHHRNPNVAYVYVRWNGEEDEFVETIAINGVDEMPDEEILFYCNSVEGLKSLTSEGSAEDFTVTGFISFDRF